MAVNQFNLEYVISVLIALSIAYVLPSNVNALIRFFLVPIVIAYITITVLNFTTPKLNTYGNKITSYIETKTYGELNSLNYLQVFPPLFAVFILFIVLLYSGAFK